MHPGTQQDQRLARALMPAYLSPDERTLAERLRQMLELARGLHFIDEQGREDGHWGQALERDESLLLAELAAFPIEAIERGLLERLAQFEPTTHWRACLELVQRLDAWCRALDALDPQSDPEGGLAVLWRGLQTRLQNEISPLLRRLQPRPTPGAPALVDQLHPLWSLDAPDSPSQPAERATPRQLGLALCRAIRQLGEQARHALPASLRSGRHDPAMGLLLAFAELLQRSRTPLHRFAERLTDYYYLERLGQAPRPCRGDRIHVLLERDPHQAQPLLLPAGIELMCGKGENGHARIYSSEQALELGTLRVAALLSLRLEADAQISPEREFGYATAAKAARIDPPTPAQAADTHAPSWPLLGGGEIGADARGDGTLAGGCRPAELGLALSSPLLLLAEGQREIELTLLLAHPADHDLLLKQLLQRPPERRSRSWLLRVHQRLAAFEERVLGRPAEWQARADLRLSREQRRALPSRQQRLMLVRLAGHRRQFAFSRPWLGYLLLRCLQASSAEEFKPALGRLFAVWLCQTGEELDKAALDALQAQARKRLGGGSRGLAVDDPLSIVFGKRKKKGARHQLERSLVFDRVFRGMWSARVSGATGWLELEDVFTVGVAAEVDARRPDTHSGRGLRISLQLKPGQPALCACRPELHGKEWPRQPVLQLRQRSQTRVFGTSLLQQMLLDRLHLRVQVQGQRQLLLYNQLGRLDAAKPFLPFGPLPDAASYLMFSSAELAAKPLDALSLQLRWAGLPADGLAAHYASYPHGPWLPSSFRVSQAVLSGGRWCNCSAGSLALFQRGAEALLALDGADLARLHRPTPGDPEQALEYGLASRDGFFKLQLASPAHGFGHALYPRLLTEVLTRNARLKHSQALPEPPYTPTLEHIGLNYESSEQLSLLEPPAAGTAARLWRIGPFGLQPLVGGAAPCHLLLPWPAQGQLLIGLAGGEGTADGPAQDRLSLLFQLEREAAREALGRPGLALQWAAWCGAQGWVELEPYRILLDQTQGMLRTGLVVLELPAGMSPDCPAMPPGLFWLRLSASGELERLAPLRGVWAQAISAVPREADGADGPLPAHALKSLLQPLPGITGLHQALPGFDLLTGEDAPAMRCRVAERLRHRQRASTPWDIERLVLQAFPEVFKLKCFPQRPGGSPAGQVLLVVVPALAPGVDVAGSEAPRLDAATLQRISEFVLERAAPGLRLLVRNAGYERLQVRCALRLARGVPSGERLRELHQTVRDYLSPWRPGGITANFDWRVGVDEIEAMLRAQEGVEAVEQVSLLHIVRSDAGHFRLSDSARPPYRRSVVPSYRWSLALPMRRHLIGLADGTGALGAQPTGLGKLTLGSNFIIGRRSA